MTEDFEFLIEEFGPPSDAIFLSDRQLADYREVLPNSLLDFWQSVGLGSWCKGLFRFVQPEVFASTISSIFSGDPQIDPKDCSVYGYTAFCELRVWHRSLGSIKVDLLFGVVEANFTESENGRAITARLGPDRVIAINLMSVCDDSELKDEAGKPLFQRALKTFGKLEPGDCYGFVPALGLGGAINLEFLRRVRAVEHFSIVAGLHRFKLVDFDENGRRSDVRMIGN